MCEFIDESADVWLENDRKAQRPHRCHVCRDYIDRGARYVEIRSLADGQWAITRLHSACRAFTEAWQLQVCDQRLWTAAPEQSPAEAIIEHIDAGDIDAAWGIAVWRAWLREDVIELTGLFLQVAERRLARRLEAKRQADRRWRALQNAHLPLEPRPQWD